MICIDSSVFLGLHCLDNDTRIFCKNLIINNLKTGIVISCEEVGKVDNVIWSVASLNQQKYFEFMDTLMINGSFIRPTYSIKLLQFAQKNNTSITEALALKLKTPFFSLKNILKEDVNELMFSNNLEIYYQCSQIVKFKKDYLKNLSDHDIC